MHDPNLPTQDRTPQATAHEFPTKETGGAGGTLLGEDLGEARVVGDADVVALAVAVHRRAAPHPWRHEEPRRGACRHVLPAPRSPRPPPAGAGRRRRLGVHLDPPERSEPVHLYGSESSEGEEWGGSRKKGGKRRERSPGWAVRLTRLGLWAQFAVVALGL